MSDYAKAQTTDAINSGFGTVDLSPNQGQPLISADLQDGGASDQGAKQPKAPQHEDV